jgi:CDP-diacylglycerol--glycerol-3-phosphate 3-phosphatidyltransferase
MLLVANIITVARVGLALLCVMALWLDQSDVVCWGAIALTVYVMYLDALDGWVARKMNQDCKFGGVLDIACDRAVELLYPIVFSAMGWIPVWVPLLFLVRGTLVDSVRAHAGEKGFTAFGKQTMMQSALGKVLVASTFSRAFYNATKIVAYCLLIAAHTRLEANTALPAVAMGLVYFLSLLCLVRGLPVILEGGNIFYEGSSDTVPGVLKVKQS